MDETNLLVAIPPQSATLQLADPALLNYYRDMENRMIWLDAEVDENTLEIVKNIIQWNIEDAGKPVEQRKPIRILIFSPGGSLDVNNAMIDAIKASRTKVISVNMGNAYSAAAFISIACHERYVMKNATYLIHRGEGQFSGTFDQVVAQLEEYQRQVMALEDFLRKNTKIPEALLQERIGSEWFVTAEEAVEYGIADKIITSLDELM